jgi:putative ABC transport system permease protein
LKIFGAEDPVGKMILLDNKGLLTVRGIVGDAPSNSHIQYNAFISFSSLYKDKNMYLDWNGGWAYYTYMLMAPGADMEALTRKFPAFMDKHINYIFKGTSWSETMMVQPLLRIYLHSNLPGEIGPVGNLSYLLLFTSIALVIFIIACINFINLTTARLTTRLREQDQKNIWCRTSKYPVAVYDRIGHHEFHCLVAGIHHCGINASYDQPVPWF